MEKKHYLIDANAVIDYLGNKLPIAGKVFLDDVIDSTPNISVISKIEILGFNTQKEHYTTLTNFIDDSNIIDLSSNIVTTTIAIRKKHKIKLPDAIIAATALVLDVVLITRNSSDFKLIEGIKLINPHQDL